MEVFEMPVIADHFSMFIIGDIHKGNANHNRKAFKKAVAIIKAAQDERVVKTAVNGDVVDCINTTDPRFNPAEIDPAYTIRDLKDLPRKQADTFLDDVEPIMDTFKGAPATIGNHCETYIKRGFFDVYDYYSKEIGVVKVGKFGLGKVRVASKSGTRRISLDVAIMHGQGGGGGKLPGYSVNFAYDRLQKYHFNAGFVGHIHKLDCRPIDMYGINAGLKPKRFRKWYCVTGCFLELHEEGNTNYFEGKPGQLSDIGFVELRIDRNHDGWKWEVVKHDLSE